jgi:glycosyltransferase involved in cell wall biosynthesis
MTIWVDVTDFEKWSGNLTGIQRVSLSLANGYSKDRISVKYFHYSDSERRFYVSNFDPQGFKHKDTPGQDSSGQYYKELLIRIVPARLINIVPTRTKSLIKKILKKARSKLNSLRSKTHRLVTKFKKNELEPKIANFSNQDIVLVPGNAWDNIYTAQDLGMLKQTIKFKLVYVMYDLIPVIEPQLFGGLLQSQYHEYLFEALTNADLLLPISKSTQRDIESYCSKYMIDQPKMEVIELGYDLPSAQESQPDWIEKDEKFVICVGTFEIRKNHLSLYYAYREILQRGEIPPKLVIVGREGWYVSDLKMLIEQDIHIKDLIIVKDNINDSELSWLYGNCQFSIYPSVYEGWGLPVSESLARGTPVLSSFASSMPEAGGRFAEYFSPYNTGQIAELIIKYTNNPDLLKTKRKEAIRNFKANSWQKSYEGVKRAINTNIINQRK